MSSQNDTGGHGGPPWNTGAKADPSVEDRGSSNDHQDLPPGRRNPRRDGEIPEGKALAAILRYPV